MPRNNKAWGGRQWGTCDRCGREYPLDDLSSQKGLLVCQPCKDNTQIERRDAEIAQILASGADEEGADLRFIDIGLASVEQDYE